MRAPRGWTYTELFLVLFVAVTGGFVIGLLVGVGTAS